MRVPTLGLVALFAMSATAALVWIVAPRLATARADVAQPPSESAEVVASVPDGDARFESRGAALTMEATLGNATLRAGDRALTYVLVEIEGGAARAKPTPPADVSLVIDRSGGMRGARLAAELRAARAFLDRMRDGDAISIVAFDTASKVVVPRTVIDASTRSSVASAVAAVDIGGDACVSCGLEEGIAELEKSSAATRRLILFAGGEPTAGVRDVAGFRGIAARARARGVAVSTIGMNLDYDERALAAIAEESNGAHYFAEDEVALARAVEVESERAVSAVAGDVEVTIDLAPGAELDRVFDRPFTKAGSRLVLPLGAMSVGEKKSALVAVRATAASARTVVATVGVAYRDLVDDGDRRGRGELAVSAAPSASALDPVVEARLARTETAAAIEEADRLARDRRLDEARRRLDDQAARVRAISLAPSTRRGDAERDVEAQQEALELARRRLERAGNDASSDAAKSALKVNRRDVFDLRR